MDNIYILIPAYNEEKVIDQVVSKLISNGFKNILIVNDGSIDNTGKIAKALGAKVINLLINRGQGAALRTGIEYLRDNIMPDIIITFDADGQHKAEDIKNLIQPIITDGYDVVLGSRFLSKRINVPLFRKIILKAGIIFTNKLSKITLTDTHNGFRAFNKKAIAKIKIINRGMEHASEIIDEISKNKLLYKEVPVEILYSEYSKAKGQRSSNFIKIGIKVLMNKIIS